MNDNKIDIIKLFRHLKKIGKSKPFILNDVIFNILKNINDIEDLYIIKSTDNYGYSLMYKSKWLGNYYNYKKESDIIYISDKNKLLQNKYK